MTITTRFDLALPLEVAWRSLLDVPSVAHCLPGVELTDVLDDRTYGGRIALTLGPLGFSYRGQVRIDSIDEASHTVAMTATGTQVRGGNAGTAVVRARLQGDTRRTTVVMETEIGDHSRMSRIGGTGIMRAAAQRMSERFAACLERQLQGAPG